VEEQSRMKNQHFTAPVQLLKGFMTNMGCQALAKKFCLNDSNNDELTTG
jgi:hypothetical protein